MSALFRTFWQARRRCPVQIAAHVLARHHRRDCALLRRAAFAVQLRQPRQRRGPVRHAQLPGDQPRPRAVDQRRDARANILIRRPLPAHVQQPKRGDIASLHTGHCPYEHKSKNNSAINRNPASTTEHQFLTLVAAGSGLPRSRARALARALRPGGDTANVIDELRQKQAKA